MKRDQQLISLSVLRRILTLSLTVVLITCSSCERKTVLDKVREEYEAGNYREAIFLVRHHLRRGGERSVELQLLAGKCWLRLGIEAEAEDAFAEVYSMDSTFAPLIAEALKEEALKNLGSGHADRGERFLVQAVNYDSGLDFGRYDAVAGELLLERKDFKGAIVFLGRYLGEYPDTAGAAEVMMNLGAAYEGSGETELAIDVYGRFQDKYPKSRMATMVRWKLENLLFKTGEELREGGDTEKAEAILIDLAVSAGNPLVRERANFLLGEIFEEKSDTEKAILYYIEVINLNLGSSGRLVDRAKERVEKLETSKGRH